MEELSTAEIIYVVFTSISVLIMLYCIYKGEKIISVILFLINVITTLIITGVILPHLFYYKNRVNKLCEKITKETDKDVDATWVTNENILDTTIELIELMQDIKRRVPREKVMSIYKEQQDMHEYFSFIHHYKLDIKEYKNGSYMEAYKQYIASIIAIDIDTKCENDTYKDIINNFMDKYKDKGGAYNAMHRAIKKELFNRNSKYTSVMAIKCNSPELPSAD